MQFNNPSRNMKTKNMTTLHLKKSIGRSPLRLAFLLISLVLVCFALSPTAQAVLPAPDGGYPGGNTAEGENALLNVDTSQGVANTAVGFQTLFNLTTGIDNTAIGWGRFLLPLPGRSTLPLETELFRSTQLAVLTRRPVHLRLPSTTATAIQAVRGTNGLAENTTGFDNTAIDVCHALFSNTTGNDNTAMGFETLYNSTTASENTAVGS